MKHSFCGLITLVLCLGMAEQSKSQPTYAFTTFDVPGSCFINTRPNGINASGQIVGSYVDAAGTHGFFATPVP